MQDAAYHSVTLDESIQPLISLQVKTLRGHNGHYELGDKSPYIRANLLCGISSSVLEWSLSNVLTAGKGYVKACAWPEAAANAVWCIMGHGGVFRL